MLTRTKVIAGLAATVAPGEMPDKCPARNDSVGRPTSLLTPRSAERYGPPPTPFAGQRPVPEQTVNLV
jgi:hypothetical protein